MNVSWATTPNGWAFRYVNHAKRNSTPDSDILLRLASLGLSSIYTQHPQTATNVTPHFLPRVYWP